MELEEFARQIASLLHLAVIEETNGEVGFTVFLTEVRSEGWATYISSFEREGMIGSIEEMIERLKSDPSSVEVELPSDR